MKSWLTDSRFRPLYGIAEAARYLMMPRTTLQSWVSGTASFDRIISRPYLEDPRLSFANLVEAHILHSLRINNEISIQSVRNAIDYAQSEFEIEHLLINPEIKHAAGDFFISRYGQLLNLSHSGQLAIKSVMSKLLQRVEYDNEGPIKLFPVVRSLGVLGPKVIYISPLISFGRPVVHGISTSVLSSRYESGENLEEIAADYELAGEEVEEAIIYESAA